MLTVSHRINTLLLVLLVVMAGAIIAMLATRAFGGPLDPPGPPSSTDGVRLPGTPISSLPFATTQGGYYYVTRNLSGAAGQSGITICCSNTTIDLGGFTLFGAGAGMSPGDGISNPGARNIVIRNGAVRGWNDGINLGGTYSRVAGVYATANLFDGIRVGGGSEIIDCTASLNGNIGIVVTSGAVRNCTVTENLEGFFVGSYSLVEGNRVNANTLEGIEVNTNLNTLRDNDFSGNAGSDIKILGLGNVFMANVFCDIDNQGSGSVFSGNVDRVDAC